MNNKLHFSSKDQTWETPQDFFDKLSDEFNFVLDVCATDETAKCANYYTPETDGLTKDWKRGTEFALYFGGEICRGWAFMNPPYGREIKLWIAKAAEEAMNGAKVIALIPSRTDTRYWHEHIWDAEKHKPRPWVREIRFVPGRLKFGNAKNSAPFPSAVIVFEVRE